jgi:hypothetical protein
MRDKMYEELKLEKKFSSLLASKKFIEYLPDRLNTISKNLSENEFKIKVEAFDEKRVTDGFQKVASRHYSRSNYRRDDNWRGYVNAGAFRFYDFRLSRPCDAVFSNSSDWRDNS